MTTPTVTLPVDPHGVNRLLVGDPLTLMLHPDYDRGETVVYVVSNFKDGRSLVRVLAVSSDAFKLEVVAR